MCGPLIPGKRSGVVTLLHSTPCTVALQRNFWKEKCGMVSYKTKKTSESYLFPGFANNSLHDFIKKALLAKLINICEMLWTFLLGLYL